MAAWFAPLIAAAAGKFMEEATKKPEQQPEFQPIQAGNNVVARRQGQMGGGDPGLADLGKMGLSVLMDSSSASTAKANSPTMSMEDPSVLARRKENLVNLDTLNKGMSVAKNNPNFKEYASTIDDAMKKARGY